MIVYRHPILADGTPMAPPWLEGVESLVSSESSTHRFAGVGEDFQMGERPGASWADVGHGWQAVRVLPDQPIRLQRRLSWAKSRVVADAEGREWQVPVVLTPHAHPGIIATYGDSWLPVYTGQQRRLLDIAQAALTALEARNVPAAVACQWAAEALEAGNHITVSVIQRCLMMDEHLAQNVLLALTGALDAAELADANHG